MKNRFERDETCEARDARERAITTNARDGRIDRIDSRGDILEHHVSARNPLKTFCGQAIVMSQPPLGNQPCKRCETLVKKGTQYICGGCKGGLTVAQVTRNLRRPTPTNLCTRCRSRATRAAKAISSSADEGGAS